MMLELLPATSDQLSKNMHVRLIVDCKLSLGVIVSVHCFLCGPVMDWDPSGCSVTAGIGSSLPQLDYVGIENGWMHFSYHP